MAARAEAGSIEAPYVVALDFAMPRPARPAHPHPTRGDLDKLVRAVLDGLTRGGLIADDRHVIELAASKRWASERGAEGVAVTVRSMAEDKRPAAAGPENGAQRSTSVESTPTRAPSTSERRSGPAGTDRTGRQTSAQHPGGFA